MRQVGMRHARWTGAVMVAVVAAVPMAASARSGDGAARARAAAAKGSVLGGVTADRFPVVLEVNRTGRRIDRMVIVLRLKCSKSTENLSDSYTRVTVSGKGRFSAKFGPETFRNDDGTTSDWSGSVSGSFNSARTRATGKWHLNIKDLNAAGAVTDTCDSGNVSWTARQ